MNSKSSLKIFIDFLNNEKKSPATIVAYKKDVEQLIDYLDSISKTIVKASSDDLENFVQKLILDEKYSLKTISRKINSFKTMYKALIEKKTLKKNPSEGIEHPEYENKKARYLSTIEYKALRDTVKDSPRLFSMVELMLQTGIRIGELSRIRVIDVSKKYDRINIAQFSSIPQRIIELNEAAAFCMKKWIAERPKIKNDEGYLFATKTGKPMLVRNIRTAFDRAFKKVGIKDASVNDLRNTFIYHQLALGVDIEKVAEIVGHQRSSSTDKYLELLERPYKIKLDKIQVL